MQIKLGENISELRRQHHMTQEMLAQTLGVTFAAVSKWERGVASPDLQYIVEMADLFEVSLDRLIGYAYRNNDKENIIKRLKEYEHTGNQDAIVEAEKALQKYPNDFGIVYGASCVYEILGVKNKNFEHLHRALILKEKSCLLLDQNQDLRISETSIQIEIATIYTLLNESEKAISILKSYNTCGVNNPRIGSTLSLDKHKSEEALQYLSEGLINCIVQQVEITKGYINVYINQKNFTATKAIITWCMQCIESLEIKNTPSFLSKAKATCLAIYANCCLKENDEINAKKYLEKALDVAKYYDENPSNDVKNIRFVHLISQHSFHDTMGNTAKQAIYNVVKDLQNHKLTTLLEEIDHA